MHTAVLGKGMVQCELCGTETDSPTKIKVEGAELQVCSNCADFGTEVESSESSSSTSTKYSTDSSDTTSTTASSGQTSSRSYSSSSQRNDMFDSVDELAQDYDKQLRQAREDRGLSQAELAKQINEKASLIRKVERGDTLPSDDLQDKLEDFFDISLSAGGNDEGSTDWQGSSGTDGYTLGDVVERKD